MEQEQQTQASEGNAKEQDQAAASAATKNTDTESQELMIPKHRYDEVSKKLRELEADAAKRAKEQQEADEKRLQEQQEWQKLADTRKGKIDELTPKAELADELSAILNNINDTEIATWPDEIKAMDPGKEVDVRIRRAWIDKARTAAEKLAGDKTPTPGNPPKPRPASSSKAEAETRAQWQRQATARYR